MEAASTLSKLAVSDMLAFSDNVMVLYRRSCTSISTMTEKVRRGFCRNLGLATATECKLDAWSKLG
jgi:hypothetical protein